MLERVVPRHASQCLWQWLEVQRRLEGTKGQAHYPEQLLPALHPCLVSDFWKLLRCFLLGVDERKHIFNLVLKQEFQFPSKEACVVNNLLKLGLSS